MGEKSFEVGREGKNLGLVSAEGVSFKGGLRADAPLEKFENLGLLECISSILSKN